MAGWKHRIRSWLFRHDSRSEEDGIGGERAPDGESGNRRSSTLRPAKAGKGLVWLVLLLLVGIVLMIVSSLIPTKNVPDDRVPIQSAATLNDSENRDPRFAQSLTDYEEWYEKSLDSILRRVVGIGEVEVFVNVDSVDEVVIEKNRQDTQQVTNEKDQKGAVREVTELVRDGEVAMIGDGDNRRPLIVKRIKPRIRGVLVVAEGVEQPILKKMVIEAIERALDVPSHRISVLPRKKS